MAILGSKDKKLILSEIYQWILDNYSYFRNRGPGWRNSIRHNLSLNDCFIKAGRSANGKGHYWAVHPANIDDFTKGDFRRRRAQRKVRKHMGLSVPDEDDSPPASPSPNSRPPWLQNSISPEQPIFNSPVLETTRSAMIYPTTNILPVKKRQFDIESLLAPDNNDTKTPKRICVSTPEPSLQEEEPCELEICDDDSNDNDNSEKSFVMSSSKQTDEPEEENDSIKSAFSPHFRGFSLLKSSYPSSSALGPSATNAAIAYHWRETFSKILSESGSHSINS